MRKPDPPCLAAALAYLRRGWSAIPLCPHDHRDCPPSHLGVCGSPGKGPLWGWKAYSQRLPKEKELRLVWNRNPWANVGVIFGRVSRLVGVDIDGPEAWDLFLEISGGRWQPAVSFTTPGGGRRLLYSLGQDVTVPRRKFSRGTSHVLVLGEGSYSVMPPSLHASGAVYQWDHN